jgi:V/A-type H+-transporting ATPase subunit I
VRLSTVRDVLQDKVDEIEAIPKFGQTEYAFVVTGWIPMSDLKELEKDLQEQFSNDVIVNQKEIDEHEFDETPVALKNPKPIEPFQTVLAAYGMPKYGTLDPTVLLFLFYPLFFGMIVGDFGYGLIMLGIVLWMRFKFRENNAVQIATSVLGPAATMVIAFGILYGEFFGDVLSHYLDWIRNIQVFGIELPFHRTVLVQEFMIIAVAVGAIQVMLGYVLGIINGIRTKHMGHVYEKGGLLAVVVGALLLVTAYLPFMEGLGETTALVTQAVAALAIFIGIFYAIKGGKVMGGIESILQFSNIASYIRIMAVGLAGAIFADAVNGIVAGMGNIILGLVIGILLHGLNFIIASFSPAIHAMRLNFLEFFGKFYETGGEEYRPFQKTRGEKTV